MKYLFEKNQFFNFAAYIVETIKYRKKCFKQNLVFHIIFRNIFRSFTIFFSKIFYDQTEDYFIPNSTICNNMIFRNTDLSKVGGKHFHTCTIHSRLSSRYVSMQHIFSIIFSKAKIIPSTISCFVICVNRRLSSVHESLLYIGKFMQCTYNKSKKTWDAEHTNHIREKDLIELIRI